MVLFGTNTNTIVFFPFLIVASHYLYYVPVVHFQHFVVGGWFFEKVLTFSLFSSWHQATFISFYNSFPFLVIFICVSVFLLFSLSPFSTFFVGCGGFRVTFNLFLFISMASLFLYSFLHFSHLLSRYLHPCLIFLIHLSFPTLKLFNRKHYFLEPLKMLLDCREI